MARMNGSLFANGGRFGPSSSSYIANVIDGGQNGFGPVLTNLDANTPPVFLPVQVVVTHVPGLFYYIPNGVQIFKALFETHLLSLDGWDISYSMDTDGTPVGRDSQQQMVPTRHVRSQPQPVATWAEKIGNVVYNFGRLWMNAIHDPDTQASSMVGIIPEGTTMPPLVSSMFSCDLLLIQYDATYRPENIIDAVALTNMFPTDIGPTGYHMNTQEAHRLDRSFTFHAIAQHNDNVKAAARQVATLLGLHRVNYQEADPIAKSVEAELSNMGMEYQASTILRQFRNLNG